MATVLNPKICVGLLIPNVWIQIRSQYNPDLLVEAFISKKEAEKLIDGLQEMITILKKGEENGSQSTTESTG